MPDPNRLLASLAQSGVALELRTLDICYLAALKLRGDRIGLAAFSEPQLLDAFEQVCAAVEADGEVRRSASHAIRRLRDQRLLTRVDGAGVVRAGEYALTRLATAIVDFVLEDETLTRESLTVLTRTLLASLRAILSEARSAATEEAWNVTVVAPLRVVVAELVGGIQRRQRGFDLQQEQVRRDMAGLLRADWFGAVERCEALLDTTSVTLRELCQVLLRDAHEMHGVLQQILELAAEAGAEPAEAAARAVADSVERVVAWGGARQRAWSEHYQYVHRFLRDVVLLDPKRALTARLREALAGEGGGAYALAVAAEPPTAVLRDVALPPLDRPPVRRPKADPDPVPGDAPADDAQSRLEAQVRAALAGGARGLGEVTAQVTGQHAPVEQFVLAGRVASAVARACDARGAAERPWLEAGGALVVEEWTLPEAR